MGFNARGMQENTAEKRNHTQAIFKMANDPAFNQAAKAHLMKSRYLDRVDIVFSLSEKEVTAIVFPDLEGKFDYSASDQNDQEALDWAKSMFHALLGQSQR